ncbi:AAA family ATPase [bacterium]|nr:AAA family ATPase [bacterium]
MNEARDTYRIFKHFGLSGNPFLGQHGVMSTQDVQDIGRAVDDCISKEGWLAVIGDAGSGKSTAVDHALRRLGVKVAKPLSPGKSQLKIQHIMDAIVYDLSEESVRRGHETKARQVNRVMGELKIGKKQRICLVIEEAHMLNPLTYKGVKSLREMDFMGTWPLLSVVMIGHQLLESKINQSREISLRVETYQMNLLSESEGAKWITSRAPGLFRDDAIELMLTSSSNIMELSQGASMAMRNAYLAGRLQVFSEDLKGQFMTLKEKMHAAGLTLYDIAQQTGKGKTTISGAVNGDPRTAVSTSNQVAEIINNALNQKLTGQTIRKPAVNQ